MTTETPTNLLEFESTAFMAVGPGRIGALTLYALFSAHDPAKDDRSEARTQSDTARSRLSKATQMLGEFTDHLKQLEYISSDALEARRVTATKVITEFNALIPDIPEDGSIARPSPVVLGKMRELSLRRLEPAITDFLRTMSAELKEEHHKRQQQRRDSAIKSVDAAHAAGRNINMIALNATIEAARAGEFGTGFKLIADEIRTQAEYTRTFLTDIADQLKSI